MVNSTGQTTAGHFAHIVISVMFSTQYIYKLKMVRNDVASWMPVEHHVPKYTISKTNTPLMPPISINTFSRTPIFGLVLRCWGYALATLYAHTTHLSSMKSPSQSPTFTCSSV